MDRKQHRARARSLLAYLTDTATDTEAALGYEGVLLELDRLVEPGSLPPISGWNGNRQAAFRSARDHLTALTTTDHLGFQVALCQAELEVVWQRERAG